LEQTPEFYVAEMVEVFREVRRVLADDGTLWLNLGDIYRSDGRGESKAGFNRRTFGEHLAEGKHDVAEAHVNRRKLNFGGTKMKEIVGLPWRVAFSLSEDGWYLRQDIVWAKPNPMPESVTDRCTKAHEYLFLLTKSPKYRYDHAAIKEPATKEYQGRTLTVRNKRSVWTIAPQPFKDAHFAVMPEALVEPCVLAGSAPGDTVLDPFSGSGTVGVVSLRHGRNYIGCELNPEYAELSRKRICDDQPLINTVEVVA
jgi:DNA modification methylase